MEYSTCKEQLHEDALYEHYLRTPYPFEFASHEDWNEAGYELYLEKSAYTPEQYKIACETHAKAEPVLDENYESTDTIPF
jgi:hypothetical protein